MSDDTIGIFCGYGVPTHLSQSEDVSRMYWVSDHHDHDSEVIVRPWHARRGWWRAVVERNNVRLTAMADSRDAVSRMAVAMMAEATRCDAALKRIGWDAAFASARDEATYASRAGAAP